MGTMFMHCSISCLMTFFCWTFFVFAAFVLDGSNILFVSIAQYQLQSVPGILLHYVDDNWADETVKLSRDKWFTEAQELCSMLCLCIVLSQCCACCAYLLVDKEMRSIDPSLHSFHFYLRTCCANLCRKTAKCIMYNMFFSEKASNWLDGRVV